MVEKHTLDSVIKEIEKYGFVHIISSILAKELEQLGFVLEKIGSLYSARFPRKSVEADFLVDSLLRNDYSLDELAKVFIKANVFSRRIFEYLKEKDYKCAVLYAVSACIETGNYGELVPILEEYLSSGKVSEQDKGHVVAVFLSKFAAINLPGAEQKLDEFLSTLVKEYPSIVFARINFILKKIEAGYSKTRNAVCEVFAKTLGLDPTKIDIQDNKFYIRELDLSAEIVQEDGDLTVILYDSRIPFSIRVPFTPMPKGMLKERVLEVKKYVYSKIEEYEKAIEEVWDRKYIIVQNSSGLRFINFSKGIEVWVSVSPALNEISPEAVVFKREELDGTLVDLEKVGEAYTPRHLKAVLSNFRSV